MHHPSKRFSTQYIFGEHDPYSLLAMEIGNSVTDHEIEYIWMGNNKHKTYEATFVELMKKGGGGVR